MLVQERQLPRLDVSTPFDWGLAFVLSKWRGLFVLSLIAGCVEVALNYYEFIKSADYKGLFLLTVAGVVINCWVVVTVMLLAVATLLGVRVRLFELAGKAFLAMPKVMLSYFMLLCLVAVFVNLAAEFLRRPFLWPFTLILFVVPLFLLWAPIFCAAEVAVKPEPKKKEDEADDFGGEDDDEMFFRIQRGPLKLFAGRPIWDLGFARSVGFSNYIPLLTAQAAILLWIASILPMGLVAMIAGYYFGFEWIAAKVLLGSVLFTFVTGIICAAFLYVLPKDAVAEFGIVPQQADDLIRMEPLRKRFGFKRRIFPFLVLVLLGSVSTYFSALWAKHQRVMPQTASIKLEDVKLSDDQLIMSLFLQDPDYEFRWLSTGGLRLKVIHSNAETAKDKEKTDKKKSTADVSSLFTMEADESDKLLVPQRVLPSTPEGAPLPEADFAPRRDPIRLRVFFANPFQANETELAFELYHPSAFELGAPLVNGVLKAPAGKTGTP